MVDPVAPLTVIVKKLPAVPKANQRKQRRWLRRGFLLLVLSSVLGWFTPHIVATTEIRNRLPKLFFPDFRGSFKLGETSLAWTSPIIIKDLTIFDEEGQSILDVRHFSTGESLWALIAAPRKLGMMKIVEPVIHVSLGDDDSNVERILATLVPDRDTQAPASDYIIEIENARVEMAHPASNRESVIDRISMKVITVNGGLQELDLAIGNPPAAGVVNETADWLAARYRVLPQGELSQKTGDGRSLVVRSAQWKLDRLSPLGPRFGSKAELRGALDADTSIVLTATDKGIEWDWNGSLSVGNFLVAGIDMLQRDRLKLTRVDLTGRAAMTDGHLAMHDLKFVTDVGDLTATGDFPLDRHSAKSPLELLQSLISDEDYHVQGRIDLKKLAALLPHTLRIREGIEVNAGEVKVQFVGVEIDGQRRWSGAAGIVGLTATKQGQTIQWERPIAARVNAHRVNRTIVMDMLECKSDFLQVTGNGTLDDARYTANGDLSKLLLNLERFVDLGIDELSGQMKANGEIRRRDNDRVELSSTILLDDFAYLVSTNSVWREKHLELTITAAGQVDATPQLTRLNSGEIHLKSGGDSLDAVLTNPVELGSANRSYAGNVDLKGQLASWQNRLRPFAAAANWSYSGDIDLSSKLSADSERIDFRHMTVAARTFSATGPEWMIQDPDVKIEGEVQCELKSRKWTSPKFNLTSKAMTVDLTDLEYTPGVQRPFGFTGTAKFRGDLAQLSNWKNMAIANPSYYLVGALSGTASIKQVGGPSIGILDAQVEKFLLAEPGTDPNGEPRWITLWKEPLLKLNGRGSYDAASDQLALDSSSLDIDGFSVSAKGKLGECRTNRRIDLSGNLAYDWDQLAKRLGPQVAKNIQLSGKDQRPFSIAGSLSSLAVSQESNPPNEVAAAPVSFPNDISSIVRGTESSASRAIDLNGQAGLGWTTANVYGIKLGAGDLSARLDHGVCQFAPLDIVVNEGKLHVTPMICLDRNPFVLVLPAERVVNQISLTPELCANALKYVAPMLSDSTEADGKISLDMQAASLPLSNPATGTASGILSIHRAQTRPGPMALQIIRAVDQVRSIISRQQPSDPNRDQTWIELSEQKVPFKLERGRFYHEELTMIVKNVTVKSSGSVGLDKTLNLIAEVAIKDEWLGNKAALAGLKGKSIQIPITGTMSQPQIDPAFFSDLVKQLGSSAIEGLLQEKVGDGLDDAINKGLDKLLKGIK